MLIKPVLNVIRVRTHTFGLAALLIGGCSVMPNERETLRIERVKEAVPPMARIALEAEQPTYERTGEPTDGCAGAPTEEPEDDRTDERSREPIGENSDRRVDKRGLRPYAIVIGGRYFLRIGVYVMEADARDLATELRRVTTEPIDVFEFGMGDGSGAVRLYRVVVGPIRSRAGLVELVETLDAQGYGSVSVPSAKPMESEPVVAPRSPLARQTAAGPELVEVLLSPEGVEAEQDTLAGDTDAEVATSDAELPPSRDVTEEVGGENRIAASPTAEPEAPAGDAATEVATTDAGLPPNDEGTDELDAPQYSTAADAAEAPAGEPPPTEPSERRVKAFVVYEDTRRFLQIGAYAVRATADTLASQLRLITSEPVFVAEVPKDEGGFLYRVRIGPLKSDASLDALLDALRSSYRSGWVLPSMEPDKIRTAFVVRKDDDAFLQVGAYTVRAAADALAAELRGQIGAASVRVTEATGSGGKLVYRVRVGPAASKDSLSALVEALESLGYAVD